MADIATLSVAVRTADLERANKSLETFANRANKAEAEAKDLGREAVKSSRAIAAANDNAAQSVGRVSKALSVARGALAGFGVALAGAFSIAAITEFNKSLAEVSTLVDDAAFSMSELSSRAVELSTRFGGPAVNQVGAYYQIISAGAANAAEATETLEAANKLALGGVTSIGVAADGLTSVLNAYGDSVDGAASVSDAMFVAMRAGKTTVGELSASLGAVAPLAATAGVEFDELLSSVAALTKGGVSTNQAMIGVRAILASIVKPTAEATKLAESLGIEFNASALEAQGLAGMMDTIVKATGGSTEQMALLFGGVEALVPALALAGAAGEDMAAIMGQMADKAGETDKAVEKMSKTLDFQARRSLALVEAAAISLGSRLEGPLAVALTGLNDNIGLIVKGAGVAGTALLTAFSPAILAGMASGLTAIKVAGVAAMTAIKVAVMANPLGALAVAIITVLSAVYLFRDEIAKVFGIDLVSEVDKAKAGFKSLEEQILRTAGVARTGLVDVAMGRSEAAQLEIVELRREREQLEAAIAKRRELRPMDALPAGMTRRAAELDQQIRAAEARLERAEADLSRAISRAQTRPAAGAVEPATGGGGGGGGAVDRQEASLADRIREANRQRLVRGYGQAVEAAMQPVQSRGVDFGGMLQGARNLIGQGMDAVSEAFERNSRAYAEAIDVVKREARGVFDTFTNALQRGASLWDAFKQAGLDAINSILRRIIDAQFDRIFANIFQPQAGGGAGNILSAVASFFGGARANGGPVSGGKAYLVGERGPEMIVPGASGMVIPNHALGGAMKIELVLAEDREAFTRVVDARVLQGVGASVTLSRAQAQNDGRKAALYRRA